MRDGVVRILSEIKAGLNPPSKEDCDRVMARWLFGSRAEKMMRYSPWSFALIKLMWKKEEEPWRK